MVARALICRPKVIMADEPVSMVDASLRATILSSLQELNRRYGISILYITHDLTTAYQICDNILIMYSGAVVEAGAVEQVIREPKHPYTQLLISSIPLPDKSKRWIDIDTEHEDLMTVPVRPERRVPVCAALPAGDGHVLGERAQAVSAGRAPRRGLLFVPG